MKILLVLCALLALVYCDRTDFFNSGRCMGLKHIVPDILERKTDRFYKAGKVTTYQLCCDQGFAHGSTIKGYYSGMTVQLAQQAVQSQFQPLCKGKTNCQFKWNLQYNPVRAA